MHRQLQTVGRLALGRGVRFERGGGVEVAPEHDLQLVPLAAEVGGQGLVDELDHALELIASEHGLGAVELDDAGKRAIVGHDGFPVRGLQIAVMLNIGLEDADEMQCQCFEFTACHLKLLV